MAAEVFPVARIDEHAKPCEPAIHVLRSVDQPPIFVLMYTKLPYHIRVTKRN